MTVCGAVALCCAQLWEDETEIRVAPTQVLTFELTQTNVTVVADASSVCSLFSGSFVPSLGCLHWGYVCCCRCRCCLRCLLWRFCCCVAVQPVSDSLLASGLRLSSAGTVRRLVSGGGLLQFNSGLMTLPGPVASIHITEGSAIEVRAVLDPKCSAALVGRPLVACVGRPATFPLARRSPLTPVCCCSLSLTNTRTHAGVGGPKRVWR